MSEPSPKKRTFRGEMVEAVISGLAQGFPHVHLHVPIDLDRTFHRDELVAAVRQTVDAFPVLGCIYQERWLRDRWVPWDGDLADRVEVRAVAQGEAALEQATREWTSQPLQNDVEPPFRVGLLEHAAGSRLLVSVDHRVADGGGTMVVVNAIAAALMGVEPFAPVGRERGLRAIYRALRFRDVPILCLEMIREAAQPLTFLRVRRRSRPFVRGDGTVLPQWRTLALSRESTERFTHSCRAAGATINDGLVALLARLAMRRSDTGPLAVGYTIDTRRFFRRRQAIVSNFAGVALVVIDRGQLAESYTALQAASAAIGEQKQRLPGVAYNLLPSLTMGWFPHGLLRWTGGKVIHQLFSYIERAMVLTNIGALDEYLAPFGDSALRASMVGPFIHGAATPIVIVTGFRGRLTLHVCSTGKLDPTAVDAYADEIRAAFEATDPTVSVQSTP